MYLFPPGCRLVKGAEEMEWYRLLPPDLIGLAYKANDEMARGRQDALKVLQLIGNGTQIDSDNGADVHQGLSALQRMLREHRQH
jgi:hypothetical protein